jgi:exonuclease VII small subunit
MEHGHEKQRHLAEGLTMAKKTYEQAIKELNATMKELEGVMEEGDLNHDQFHTVLNQYTKGVILRAMLQSRKTLKEMK